MEIECVIRHEGGNWVVENSSLRVAAPTLEDLDREVAAQLRAAGVVAPGEQARVFMAFDNSTIPQWIRQYAQHYFNRVITVIG